MPVGRAHSIRFEQSVEKKLSAVAAVDGVSPESKAREIVTERLNDGETELVKFRLGQLENQISDLRKDLATAIEALMVLSTSEGQLSQDEIKSWVKNNLFRRSD